MPVVKPLVESLQKELAKEQEQAALKHQLRAYRKWFSALDRNPPQREVVPGYAQGGRVWSPGYAAQQLSSPAYQQYTPQELEYIRLLEEKNRQAGAGTAFDVIPGNVVTPTMQVGYTPQEQEYIRLLAEKDKPKQELVQLLEPMDVRTRQEIIFRGETPEQVAERNAETVRDLVGPRGNWATEQEALESVRKLRAAADKYGGTLRVFEDGGVAAEDKDGYSLVSAETWERIKKGGNLTGSPGLNGYRVVPELGDQPLPTPGPPDPSRRPAPPRTETPMPTRLTPEGLTPFHKQFSENFIKNFVNRGSEHAKEGLGPDLAGYAEHLDVRPDWPAQDYRSKDQNYGAYYDPSLGNVDVYVPVRNGGQMYGKGINANENLMRHELLHGVLPFLGAYDVKEQHAAIELIYPVWQQLQARGIELTRAMVTEMVEIANSYGIQGTDAQGHTSPEETALLQQRVPELVQKYSGNSRGGRVVVPGYAEGGRVWSPGYAANRLASPAYDDEEEQRRRNGGYTDKELAYIRLLEQKQGGGAFDVIPGTGYQAQPTMQVGYTPKELEYIRLLEEKEKEPVQWRPGYAADKLEESVEATAARLNPAASAYEAGRQVEPGLRPSNVDKNPFASLNVFERQAEIFRGMEPGTRAVRALGRLEEEERQALLILAQELEKDQYTAADLERFFQQRGNTDYLESDEPIARTIRRARETMQLLTEKKAEVAAGKDPGQAIREIEATLQERETGGVRLLEFSPLRTELPGELFEPLPDAIEGPARMAAEGVLSPLGLASGATFGAGQLLKGSAASVGAGAATAPLGPVPQQAAMIAADVLAGGPSRAPGRLADDVPAIRNVADDIIPEAGMQPGARMPRTMSPEPALPSRAVTNDTIRTTSGREIPIPNAIRLDTPRKATNDVAKVNTWLVEQAQAEAAARGDEFNGLTFSRMNPRRLSQADKDLANTYLFGEANPEFSRITRAEPPTPTAPREPDLLPPSAASAPPSPRMGDNPPPQFGTTRPEFRGEQGGLQSRMFSPEETGQRGQIGLEDVVTPRTMTDERAALGRELRQIDTELEIQRDMGRSASATKRIRSLEEQRRILEDFERRGVTDPRQQAEELSEMALALESRAPRQVGPGYSPAFGTAERSEYDLARRGVGVRRSDANRSIGKAAYEAQGNALDEVGERLGVPVKLPEMSMAGGAPLTAEQIAARRAPIRETFAAKPAREAREAWRRYDGAIKVATIQQSNWADETYRLARQSKTPIVRGLKQPTSDAQVDLMERVFGAENRRDPIGTFQPNQRETMQRVYDYFDETTNLALERIPGFDQRALPEYATHMFVQRNVQRPGKGGINLRPGFLKHREATGTLGEILAARPDLDLATWDPVQLAVMHRRSVERYIAGIEEMRDLAALGLIRPVEAGLPGWRPLKIAEPARLADEYRGWVGPPQVATRLEQQFTKESFFDAYGPASAVKSLRETLFKLKVAGGLFQGIDFTARAIGRGTAELAKGHPLRATRAWFSPIHSVARSVIPGLDRAMLKRVESNPILLAGYRNGLSAGVDTSLADTAIRGMGSFVPQTVMGRQIPGANPLAQVLEFVSGGAYQKFHRDMLEQDYLINFEKFKRGIDLPGGLGMGTRREIDDIARRAAEDTNVFYSSLPNWQSAIRSATGRDLAKLGAFAPGEVEAWFRLPFQSPAGFAGIIGATVIAAELLNKHFTGEWLSEEQLMPYTVDKDEWKRFKKDPASIWKSGVPGVDYNTKFLRPKLPWQGPDGRFLYLDLLGQADTPFRWALDPKFAIQTRLGQIPSALMDLKDISSGNAPPFGEKIEGPADFGRWAAQEVSPIALQGLGGTERGRIGTLATGVQAGGLNISAEPIGERKQRKLDELFEQGYFPERAEGGAAAGVRPTIKNLLTTERAKLKEDFPELFSDPGEEFKQDVREGVSDDARDVIMGDFIASAKQSKHSILDSIMRDARTGRLGSLEEDETRKRLWEEGRDALQEYRAKVDEARKLNPSDWEPEDPTHKRTLDRFYKLISSLPEIPADADWERFDKGMATFSDEELILIEQVTGEGDHAFEKARRDANKKLSKYWDTPEGDPRADLRASDAEIDGLLWAIGNGKVRSSDHIDEALDAFEQIYGYRPPRSAVKLTEGAANYESTVQAMEGGTFNFEEDRAKAAGTIDDALPPNDPRRREYERMSSQVGEGSQYDRLESGKPRENFREQNPEIDAILWVLGKTTVVRTAAAGRIARELYQQLWGVTPPWPRLAE